MTDGIGTVGIDGYNEAPKRPGRPPTVPVAAQAAARVAVADGATIRAAADTCGLSFSAATRAIGPTGRQPGPRLALGASELGMARAWRAEHPPVRLAIIADRLGVSTATVSRALRRTM